MSVSFDMDVTEAGVTLRPHAPDGLLARLRRKSAANLTSSDPGDAALATALADLTIMSADGHAGINISPDRVFLSHDVVAGLEGEAAAALGLPPLPDLTFSTDTNGIVGQQEFKLTYRWLNDGAPEATRRIGAILQTSRGDRRLPRSILDAIEISEKGRLVGQAAQWEALARFKQSLDGEEDSVGAIAMTEFLRGLDVHLASGFSMEPKPGEGGLDFEVIAHRLQDGEAKELDVRSDGLASGIRTRGSLPAYRLGSGSFVVVDSAARPVLEAMAAKQRAPAAERDAFVRNPLPAIVEAIEADRAARGIPQPDDPNDWQEELERATASFIELEGYADRVTGIERYERPPSERVASGNTWMADFAADEVIRKLPEMTLPEIIHLESEVASAIEKGETSVQHEGVTLPVHESLQSALKQEIRRREEEDAEENGDEDKDDRPLILKSAENEDELEYVARLKPRGEPGLATAPCRLETALHAHQLASLGWAVSAWSSGLPGILNADEQGLGKTLQTIAFLAWLQDVMEAGEAEEKAPILVVAPTSLLRTWEAEVRTHLSPPGLGALFRLYGPGLSAYRTGSGAETDDGQTRLDIDVLRDAIAEGRGHRMWALTTYQTLTRYQHSLGRYRFSAVVFDEIQALKNPASLASKAALAMNADFRIGLTGTPVENAVTDLWAVMEQLAPGALGSRKEFAGRYLDADASTLAELNERVFAPTGHPPFAIRRLKQDAAAHLPPKRRLCHPRAMPEAQADAYDAARSHLALATRSQALRVLQHIRGVSLHPKREDEAAFEDASARVHAMMDVLSHIHERGEKVLVFLEDRRMQSVLVAKIRARFGLGRVDVINGSTPVPRRQAIVERFQQGKGRPGFDVLVLGPKAAGTGLTLTAATHVIHLSRWWNPAVEAQCDDRVHRIGQTGDVTVHIPVAVHPGLGEGSFDCLLHALMERKRSVARQTLAPSDDASGNAQELTDTILSASGEARDPMEAMRAVYAGLGKEPPRQVAPGTFELPD